MKQDNPYLLDLLGIVFDPENKFHTQNANRSTELFLSTTDTGGGGGGGISNWGTLNEGTLYAQSPREPRSVRGWLVDLINRFGQFGGFDNLIERINMGFAYYKSKQTASNASEMEVQTASVATSSLSLSDDSSFQVPACRILVNILIPIQIQVKFLINVYLF